MVKKNKNTTANLAKCYFCQTKTEPDYKAVDTLAKYLSERGRIIAKSKTNTCSKHQRRLTKAIKRSRYIGLLPFIAKPH